MSVNKKEDDLSTTRGDEEIQSPRKRACLDSVERKSWSLMDRRTDQEVLHEMGVSLLEQDDSEPQCDINNLQYPNRGVKRKHDIENVNPNVNSMSPRKSRPRLSPKSTPDKYLASPGPSKIKSPYSTEKVLTDQQLADTTLEMLLKEEETPIGQSVNGMYIQTKPPSTICSTGGRKPSGYTPLGVQEELILGRRMKSEHQGTDSFVILSDEMILSIFRWLPKRTLAHCMLVCKRWHRVASDETLWQRLDLGNKTLSKNAIGKVLTRQPVIVRLASSEIGAWHPPSPPSQSKIQFLDLSMCVVDNQTLNHLLVRCEALKKLSLESLSLSDESCRLIGKCSNLETLNLAMAQGITEDGLTSILEGCLNLQSLNISWCNLNESALEVLVKMLPQRLKRLNVAGARILTDAMASGLAVRCPRLQELDLSDCCAVGEPCVDALLRLQRLEHLALSRCYRLPAHLLQRLSGLPALQYLEVWGLLQSPSLNALRSALPAIHLNQFMFSAIARPTVGTRRTSIWGLRTRD